MVICASINSLQNLHNQTSQLKQTKKKKKEKRKKKKEIYIINTIFDTKPKLDSFYFTVCDFLPPYH